VLLTLALFTSVYSVTAPVPGHAAATDFRISSMTLMPAAGTPGTWVTVAASLNKTLPAGATCSFTASSPNFFSDSSSDRTCTVTGNAIIGSFRVRPPEQISVAKQLPGLNYTVQAVVTATGYTFDGTGSTKSFIVTPRIGLSLISAAAQPWPSSIVAMATQTVYVHGWGYNASSTACTYKASPGPFSSIATASSCSVNAGEMSGQFTVTAGGVGTTQTIFVNGTAAPATEFATGSLSIAAGPSILLTPSTGAPGTRVSITGIGFSLSDLDTCSVSYKVTGGGALYTSPPTCTMTTVGSWRQPSATFTVVSSASPGVTYYVNVTGTTGDNAFALFTPSGSANITLSAPSGTAGQSITIITPLPSTNRFSLLDYGLCTISSNPAGLIAASNCYINATGQIPAAITYFVVSSTAPGGVYAVTVTGSPAGVGDYSNPASFTVGPKLALSPTSGSPPVVSLVTGTEVTVSGTGFRGPGTGCTISSTTAGLTIDTAGEPACTVSAGGVLAAKFRVGAGSRYKPAGYVVNVTGPLFDWATAPFNVNATIALSPSSGSAGTLVSVFGSGFNASAGACTGPTGTPVNGGSCTQIADGTISGQFTVKAGTLPGSYIIAVGNTPGPPPSATTTFQVGLGPIITLTPSVGPTGTTVTVTGSGWNALDTSVTLRVTSGGDLWDLPASRTCGVSGGSIVSGCSFTVKLNAKGGIHTINVTGTQFDTVLAEFLVQSTLILTPASGPTGTFVTMSGSGYLNNATDCAGYISASPALFASSPALKCRIVNHVLSGNFTVALFTPAVTYGAHLVTLSNSSWVQQGSISATFTVNVPTISLSPSSGPRGMLVTVSGSNFNLNDTSCTIIPTTCNTLGCSACVITGPGTISGIYAVNGTAGSQLIVITGYGPPGSTKYDNATAIFTIEAGITMMPTSGRAGTNVILTGTNFSSADTGCTITSSPGGLITSPVCTLAGGSMSGAFTVASGTNGSYTVIITGTSGDVGRASFNVPAPPTLTLSPVSGPVGTAVIASGSNYLGATCLITAVPSSLFTSSSCSLSGGVLTGGFIVASGAATGSYTVTVQTNAGAGDSATAVFTVGLTTTTTPTTTFTLPTTTTLTTALTTTTSTTSSVTTSTSISSTTMSTTATTTAPWTLPRPCIIATVTFGSEVSSAVQFLRSFRDGVVLSTKAGSAFMEVFNAWYYSFSPSVAGFIAGNDPLRAPVRVLLYPLLGILGVSSLAYSLLGAVPELAIVVAGLVASSLMGLVYLTVPAMFGVRALLKRRRIRLASLAKCSLALLAIALTSLTVGELTGSFLLLAVGGSAIVLTCLVAAPAVFALAMLRPNPE